MQIKTNMAIARHLESQSAYAYKPQSSNQEDGHMFHVQGQEDPMGTTLCRRSMKKVREGPSFTIASPNTIQGHTENTVAP